MTPVKDKAVAHLDLLEAWHLNAYLQERAQHHAKGGCVDRRAGWFRGAHVEG